MKRFTGVFLLIFTAFMTVNAQTAQERYEEFKRKATADYESFREEALNRYEDFLEQAWQEYNVFAGKQPDNTPKPVTQPTISEDQKATMLSEDIVYHTMEAIPDTTNVWFSNLQWNGSQLERVVDKGIEQLRGVNQKISSTVITLSDIARERRKKIAERIRKMRTISEDYVAPSELRRIKREKALAEREQANNKVKKQEEGTSGNHEAKQSAETSKDSSKDELIAQMNTEAPNAVVDESNVKAETEIDAEPIIDFELYGLHLSIPAPGIAPEDIKSGSSIQQQAVAYWKKINKTDLTKVLDALTEASLLYSLGDWCTFKAVEQYATTWAGEYKNASHIMTQYLMINMGYDVRLSVSEGKIILLLPFEQEVYGTSYIPISGKRYYLHTPTSDSHALLSTCVLPKEHVCDQMNLIKNEPIRLPRKNKLFTVEDTDLHITGNLNLNIIQMQQEFPLMASPCYAASLHDDSIRLSIVMQLKKQVKDLPEEEAANALLHFVERAFEYKTDRDQFGPGVEKPFFFEEMLYHPYCDCEDRSIFYSYLVKHVLGLDVVLIHFPGHACTAVAFSEPPRRRTCTYTYKGKRFYICDPTYIVADVGMCMPSFVDTTPSFMEWYNIKEQ